MDMPEGVVFGLLTKEQQEYLRQAKKEGRGIEIYRFASWHVIHPEAEGDFVGHDAYRVKRQPEGEELIEKACYIRDDDGDPFYDVVTNYDEDSEYPYSVRSVSGGLYKHARLATKKEILEYFGFED